MKKIKTVVVDDEASNIRLIIKLISGLSRGFEICGEAGSVQEAFTLISKVKPQLVFLDIKMVDGTGFTLLEMFNKIEFEVVFISAFDEYALKAFEFNAMDYILKPVNPEKFSKTLHKISSRIEKEQSNEGILSHALQTYDQQELIISKISIHHGGNVVLLNIPEIMYIRAEDKCTLFKTSGNEKYSSSKELMDFEFIFENYPYILRINRSTFVNINYITRYSKGSTCILTMKDDSNFEISRRKKSSMLELLAGKNLAVDK